LILRFLKLASIAIAISLAFVYIDPEKTWLAIKDLSAFDMAATVSMILMSFLAAGARWATMCRGVGIPSINTWKKIKLNYAASFVDMILPIYGGSDAFCAFSVSSQRGNCGIASVAGIVASRANGYLIAIFICLISSFYLRNIQDTWRIMILLLFILVLILIAASPWVVKIVLQKLIKANTSFSWTNKSRTAWGKALFFSVVAQVFLISSRAWVGWGAGVDLSWTEYAFISSILLILTPLIPSFGFIGIGTVTFVSFASYMGADPEAATAMSIAWYGCWTLAIIPGLYFLKDFDTRKLLDQTAGIKSLVRSFRLDSIK